MANQIRTHKLEGQIDSSRIEKFIFIDDANFPYTLSGMEDIDGTIITFPEDIAGGDYRGSLIQLISEIDPIKEFLLQAKGFYKLGLIYDEQGKPFILFIIGVREDGSYQIIELVDGTEVRNIVTDDLKNYEHYHPAKD